MRSLILIFAVAFAAIALGGSTLPPERGVSLDFNWLSPPSITPDSSTGAVTRIADALRLSSRPGSSGPSFVWSLRYPVSADEFPVLVMRYRASRIGLSTEPVIALELSPAGITVPVAGTGQLDQSDAIQEFRKDLRPLPPAASIARIRFALPPAVKHLDILELTFERASEAGPTTIPVRQDLSVTVLDEFNRPVPNASVLAGPLERKNWSSEGTTDASGVVTLAVISPTAGLSGGMLAMAEPTEVAISRPGYAPQYLPKVDVRSDRPFAVRLSRPAEAPAAEVQATETLPPQTSEEPRYVENNNYYSYNDDVDDYRYDHHPYWYGYGGYGYSPGYVVVVVNNPDHNGGNGNGNGNGGQNGNGNNNNDFRTPPLPPPAPQFRDVPWPNPVARYGVTSVPRYGVTSAATYGVVSAPRFGVISAPSQGVITAPTQGITTSPGQGITTSPRMPVVTSPSPRVNSTPAPNVDRTPMVIRPPSSLAGGGSRQIVSRPSREVSTPRSYSSAPRTFSAPTPMRTPSRVQIASPMTPTSSAPGVGVR